MQIVFISDLNSKFNDLYSDWDVLRIGTSISGVIWEDHTHFFSGDDI